MIILGISGPKGVGKTTLSRLLTDCGWKIYPFAAPIKVMIASLLIYQGMDDQTVGRCLNGDLKETPTEFLNNQTPRLAMQTLGTEWRDLIDKNLWTGIWERKIKQLPDSSKIIVDDMRFVHEAEVVKRLGGKIILLLRKGCEVGDHPSEREFSNITFDAFIENNGTPDEMLTMLAKMMDYWK